MSEEWATLQNMQIIKYLITTEQKEPVKFPSWKLLFVTTIIVKDCFDIIINDRYLMTKSLANLA